MPNALPPFLLNILQIVSIAGSLLFAALAVVQNTKARKASNLIALNRSHRDLWLSIMGNPHGKRILDMDADIHKQPISKEEHRLVVLAILHLASVYQVYKLGNLSQVDGMQRDISDFFQHPVPRAVWTWNKKYQNRDFVVFVDGIIGS